MGVNLSEHVHLHCLSLHATLSTVNCARRHMLANSEYTPTNSESGQELRHTCCRMCPTGAFLAKELNPSTRRSELRTKIPRLAARDCQRCLTPYNPTGHRQKYCPKCKGELAKEKARKKQQKRRTSDPSKVATTAAPRSLRQAR